MLEIHESILGELKPLQTKNETKLFVLKNMCKGISEEQAKNELLMEQMKHERLKYIEE